MAARIILLPVPIVLTGFATAYIGAGLGCGQRYGLITGRCRRTGQSVRADVTP